MFACGTFVGKTPDRHMPGKGAHQSAPRNGVGIPDDIEGMGRDRPDLLGSAAHVGLSSLTRSRGLMGRA
jgi:hypothetical protein